MKIVSRRAATGPLLVVALVASSTVALAQAGPSAGKAITAAKAGPVFTTRVSSTPDTHSAGTGEAWVVFNPRHPKNLVITWTSVDWPRSDYGTHVLAGCIYAVSHDGGHRWGAPRPFPVHGPVPVSSTEGDPAVVSDSTGQFIMACETAGAFEVATSTDNGDSWSQPTVLDGPYRYQDATSNPTDPDAFSPGADRQYLAADLSTGRLYDSAGSGALGPRGMTISASTDHGKTWTVPVPINSADYPSAFDRGSPPSAAFGAVAVTYPANSVPAGTRDVFGHPAVCPCLVFETSHDLGRNWIRRVLGPAPLGASNTTALVLEGNATPAAPGMVAADPNHRGRFAVAVPTRGNYKVFRTLNGGETWSTSTIRTDNAELAHVQPWLNYGPKGELGIVWRTVYADGGYDVFAAISVDGGKVFTNARKLNSGRLLGPIAHPGDDCACDVQLDGHTLYTSWGENVAANNPGGLPDRYVDFARWDYRP